MGEVSDTIARRLSLSHWSVLLLTWLAMLGFDFFLHGGLLARLYVEESPFLLAPEGAFRLIPLGYLSFLLIALLLVWLLVRLGTEGWRAGLVFGLKVGALIWGATTLGLLSVTTADPTLMLGWFAGQTIEIGIGGMVAGAALATQKRGRLFVYVIAFVLVAFVITVALQNLGVAPAAKTF
jgi:hypothetical protein